MPTEREAVERERAAWVAGRVGGWPEEYEIGGRTLSDWVTSAAVRYPYPKVTRPRVVRDPEASLGLGDVEWRCVEGKLEFRHVGIPDDQWRYGSRFSWGLTPARVALWADLIARPTEEVEEEGP